jgi:hypothetical protein
MNFKFRGFFTMLVIVFLCINLCSCTDDPKRKSKDAFLEFDENTLKPRQISRAQILLSIWQTVILSFAIQQLAQFSSRYKANQIDQVDARNTFNFLIGYFLWSMMTMFCALCNFKALTVDTSFNPVDTVLVNVELAIFPQVARFFYIFAIPSVLGILRLMAPSILFNKKIIQSKKYWVVEGWTWVVFLFFYLFYYYYTKDCNNGEGEGEGTCVNLIKEILKQMGKVITNEGQSDDYGLDGTY